LSEGKVYNLVDLGSDTTQLDNEITKDTTDTSQLSQSSQRPKQDPTKLQKDLHRRRTGHRASNVLSSSLFKREVYINKLGSLDIQIDE